MTENKAARINVTTSQRISIKKSSNRNSGMGLDAKKRLMLLPKTCRIIVISKATNSSSV